MKVYLKKIVNNWVLIDFNQTEAHFPSLSTKLLSAPSRRLPLVWMMSRGQNLPKGPIFWWCCTKRIAWATPVRSSVLKLCTIQKKWIGLNFEKNNFWINLKILFQWIFLKNIHDLKKKLFNCAQFPKICPWKSEFCAGGPSSCLMEEKIEFLSWICIAHEHLQRWEG